MPHRVSFRERRRRDIFQTRHIYGELQRENDQNPDSAVIEATCKYELLLLDFRVMYLLTCRTEIDRTLVGLECNNDDNNNVGLPIIMIIIIL